MSVARCQQEVDAAEFIEWIAYDHIEPIGDDRGDVLAAMVVSTIINMTAGRRGAPVSIKDAMPQWDAEPNGEPVKESPEMLRAKMIAWAQRNRVEIKSG